MYTYVGEEERTRESETRKNANGIVQTKRLIYFRIAKIKVKNKWLPTTQIAFNRYFCVLLSYRIVYDRIAFSMVFSLVKYFRTESDMLKQYARDKIHPLLFSAHNIRLLVYSFQFRSLSGVCRARHMLAFIC